MDRWFRRVEIALLVMLGLIYAAAKIHFFSRFQAYHPLAYVADHGPFGQQWLLLE
jgi:hypothetical protein